MKLNDERRKVLSEYLGLCWHEGRMPINCGYRCVKCGDTYVVNRTFDNDADMIALFRKLTDTDDFNPFYSWAMWKHTYWSIKNYEEMIKFLFYDPKRFCELVGEWLEEIKTWPCGESQRPKSQDSEE